jgi:tryptophanyl-tRNA synthetase
VATLPGLDGRKMSKSYDNTIPLFASRAQLQKLIASLKTDSRLPHEPKETEGSALFQIYQAFASAEETQALRQRYAQGIAWSEAKQLLLERIDQEIAPMRARYQHLIDHPQEVEALLLEGAQKARASATPFMRQLRHAVGLRPLPTGAGPAQAKASKTALASFKQYREADGKFYFKLVDTSGAVLLQSLAFDAPKLAGQTIASLVQDPAALDAALPLLQALSAQQRATAEDALHALRQANAATT